MVVGIFHGIFITVKVLNKLITRFLQKVRKHILQNNIFFIFTYFFLIYLYIFKIQKTLLIII
jgi:hypothetical protein